MKKFRYGRNFSIFLSVILVVSCLSCFSVNASLSDGVEYEIKDISPHDKLPIHLMGSSISRGGIYRIDSKIELTESYPYWSGIDLYDESFFNDNFLLFINSWVGMGGESLHIGAVDIKENSIDIEVLFRGLPEGMSGPSVVTYYTFLFEFNRKLDDKDISVTIQDRTTLIPSPAPNLSTASDWARNGITEAYNKGFIPADLQNNYTDIITRAEFCRVAVKWVEYATGKRVDAILTERGLFRDSNAFIDTSDPDILAAFDLGITNGVGNNQFDPDGQFAREQAATMIMNTCMAIGADVTSPPPSGFADMDNASSWAHGGINFVLTNGIMQGTGNNNFSPKETYTIQESIMTFNNINYEALLSK